jgi:hypothetical protein
LRCGVKLLFIAMKSWPISTWRYNGPDHPYLTSRTVICLLIVKSAQCTTADVPDRTERSIHVPVLTIWCSWWRRWTLSEVRQMLSQTLDEADPNWRLTFVSSYALGCCETFTLPWPSIIKGEAKVSTHDVLQINWKGRIVNTSYDTMSHFLARFSSSCWRSSAVVVDVDASKPDQTRFDQERTCSTRNQRRAGSATTIGTCERRTTTLRWRKHHSPSRSASLTSTGPPSTTHRRQSICTSKFTTSHTGRES